MKLRLALLAIIVVAATTTVRAQELTRSSDAPRIEDNFEKVVVASNPIKIADKLEAVWVEMTHYDGEKTKRFALVPPGQKFKIGETALLHAITAWEGKEFLKSYDLLEKRK